MSGKFNMNDYVDVAERIREFHAKYPDGSLQSTLTRLDDGWLCRAEAYRNPEDPTPGVGHAFEPVPGKTPYTKDSEAMNAETSAWGRAIVALGFETKKIASAQEVQARQESQFKAPKPKPAPKIEPGQKEQLQEIAGRLIEAKHITREQLNSAVGGTFDERLAELSKPEAADLIQRLETYEQNLAAVA